VEQRLSTATLVPHTSAWQAIRPRLTLRKGVIHTLVHMPNKDNSTTWINKWIAFLLLAPIVLLLLPVLAARGLVHLAYSATLHGLVWVRFERFVVFVYSDSPKWKDHVESHILPALPAGAMVINRSCPWSASSLAGRVFRHFGGQREYSPIGMVIDRGALVRRFRFYTPYLSARKGDDAPLLTTYADFVDAAKRGR